VRVVILNERRSEREAIVRALPPDVYRVEASADEKSGLEVIANRAPEIIVFSVPQEGGGDLTRRLRGADSTGHAYLLAIFDGSATAKEIASVIACGAHDFILRPNLERDLLERVRAPARLIRWAKAVVQPAAFDFSHATELSELKAWKNLHQLVCEDLAGLTGESLSAQTGFPARFEGECRSATIALSLATERVELSLSLVFDGPALAWLRQNLLGDTEAPDEAVDDALRELANTAGGAVKRVAMAENVTLTTGLPRNGEVGVRPTGSAAFSLNLGNGGPNIALVADIHALENRRVAASELTEGMIVAHDVKNAAGMLLVPAGSRLTLTSAARLAKALGSRFFLEVAPAA